MSASYGIIYTVTLIMNFLKGVFNIPQTVSINTSPFYYGQRKFGQPLLGAQPKKTSSYIVALSFSTIAM